MSGGLFCYKDIDLKTEIFGWEDKPSNVFEDIEISNLVWDVLDIIHDFDWYKSGDTSEEEYRKSKTAFKEKWFSNHEETVRRTIDEALSDLRNELYRTYII